MSHDRGTGHVDRMWTPNREEPAARTTVRDVVRDTLARLRDPAVYARGRSTVTDPGTFSIFTAIWHDRPALSDHRVWGAAQRCIHDALVARGFERGVYAPPPGIPHEIVIEVLEQLGGVARLAFSES